MTAFNLTVSANTQNFNLNTALVAAGWNGTDVVEATLTVNAGIYVWSDSTSIAGMSITTLPANSTVSLINNGFIMGKGGAGGAAPGGYAPTAEANGKPGGPAISLANNIILTNNSYIAGGGGGGGAGDWDGGGGGAGGGAGGLGKYGAGTNLAGGAGGAIGVAGSDGTSSTPFYTVSSGGGGGRILPGNGGAISRGDHVGQGGRGKGGQAGGGGGASAWNGSGDNPGFVADGGPGGARNSPANFMGPYGSTDSPDLHQACGGGGWGSAGGTNYRYSTYTVAKSGGAGGKSIALNGYTVIFITTGIIYGEFS